MAKEEELKNKKNTAKRQAIRVKKDTGLDKIYKANRRVKPKNRINKRSQNEKNIQKTKSGNSFKIKKEIKQTESYE